MRNDKLIEYETKFLKRKLSDTQFKINSDQNGNIILLQKKKNTSYQLIIASLVTMIGYLYNHYVKFDQALGYVLFSIPILFYLIIHFVGKRTLKNFYFEFNPEKQKITYNQGMSNQQNTFITNGDMKVRWEIDEYYTPGHPSVYSATFFINEGDGPFDTFMLQLNCDEKNECFIIARAISKYITKLSDIRKIDIIENPR